MKPSIESHPPNSHVSNSIEEKFPITEPHAPDMHASDVPACATPAKAKQTQITPGDDVNIGSREQKM
jgi:hypothetical protein